MKFRQSLVVAALANISSYVWAQGHTHVHGIATLQVAVEGAALTLRLVTPLDNLVGFEHAPRTEQQKKALREAEEALRAATVLFVPSAGARCAATSVKVDSPFAAKSDAKDRGEKAKSGKEATEAHSEFTAEYVFRCEQSERLQGVEVKLFDRFRGVRRLDVELAGPRGQKSLRLTPKQRIIAW
jgi:hypothetical protein